MVLIKLALSSKKVSQKTHNRQHGAAVVEVLRELEGRRNLFRLTSNEADRRHRDPDQVHSENRSKPLKKAGRSGQNEFAQDYLIWTGALV